MTSPNHQSASSTTSPWRIPLAGWLGVSLLAVSVAVAVWSVRAAGDGSRADTPSASASGSAGRSEGRTVCFGFGDVEQRITSLYPLQPGQVTKITARENEEVEAGTALLLMDDTLAQATLREAKAALAEAEAQLEQARKLPQQHREQLEGQRAVIQAKEHELEGARARREQAVRLQKSTGGPIEDVKVAEATVAALESALKGEQAKLRGLEALDPQVGVTRAEQKVEACKAGVTKAEFALKQCRLAAPCKGTVLRVNVAEGDTLGPNPRQPAVEFCPAGPRIIRAEVEQEWAARVFKGQPAWIQDDASAGASWRGRVSRISDWYTHRRSILMEPLQLNDVRTLEIIVTLDPDQPPIKIGQRMLVTLEGKGG
jgi:multidrug resistance efflux pump